MILEKEILHKIRFLIDIKYMPSEEYKRLYFIYNKITLDLLSPNDEEINFINKLFEEYS